MNFPSFLSFTKKSRFQFQNVMWLAGILKPVSRHFLMFVGNGSASQKDNFRDETKCKGNIGKLGQKSGHSQGTANSYSFRRDSSPVSRAGM